MFYKPFDLRVALNPAGCLQSAAPSWISSCGLLYLSNYYSRETQEASQCCDYCITVI